MNPWSLSEGWTGLNDIVGPALDPARRWQSDSDRVVAFKVEDGNLWLLELCDECFDAQLTPAQLDKLIAWLVAARETMS